MTRIPKFADRICSIAATRRTMLAFLVCAASTSVGLADVFSGPTVNPVNGHSYYVLTQATWTASEAEAVALGGHLVTINDADEDQFVLGLKSFANQELWIGFTDEKAEGDWRWASGEPVTFTNWRPGEPNNWGPENYAHYWHDGSGWNDTNGNNAAPYGVVEVVPEPASLLLTLGGTLGFVRRRTGVACVR